jgi:DNA-directed RNA polymerase subunit M/transcription elongation factor TFIIS
MPYSNWILVQNTDNMQCPKCHSTENLYTRTYESFDGDYEDYQYRCQHCSHEWWIDGADY